MPSAVRRFLWAIPAAVTFTDVIASVIKVEGASMQPTLNPPSSSVSDWVLVEKLTIKVWRQYTRGEVVVLWAPDDPHQQLIKRMIAVEGDTVVVAGSKGSKKLQDISQGRCWIEGDNAEKSGDSVTAYGPVHLGLLEGRVTHVVWPPWRAGRVAAWNVDDRIAATADVGQEV